MIRPSAMRNAVLQATALFTLQTIFTHYFSTGAIMSQAWEASGLPNTTVATNQSRPFPSTNTTALNGTLSEIPTPPFYSRTLPLEGAILLVTCTLKYIWLLWLEKILPARPRRKDVVYQGKSKVEESEDREEEVVKKWIAQGRVRRASLNWCNTFLKWVLDSTLGDLVVLSVTHLARSMLHFQSPTVALRGLRDYILNGFFNRFFSSSPLIHLIAFMLVPAHKQLVFIAGAGLFMRVFLSSVLRVVAPWAYQTQYVRDMVRNMTAATERAREYEDMLRERNLKNEL